MRLRTLRDGNSLENSALLGIIRDSTCIEHSESGSMGVVPVSMHRIQLSIGIGLLPLKLQANDRFVTNSTPTCLGIHCGQSYRLVRGRLSRRLEY